jgi:XTP/dITP diphosphohydrolase
VKILIATKNPGKAREIKEFLGASADWRIELVSLADLPGAPDVEETGKTFEENALLKAKIYFEWSGIPSIADDAGLEIDFLNGEPGVLSRRWPGYEATDEELIELALKKLEGVPREKRTAHLRTVGLYYDGKNILSRTAGVQGLITENYIGHCEKGYPFRSIFWIPELNKLYQDLTHEEHEKINHRKVVYGQLAQDILALNK